MSKSSGPIFIAIAALLWGVDGILRRSLFTLPPTTIVFYEHLIGALLITPFFLPKLKTEHLTSKEWSSIIWVSFFASVLGTLLFTAALVQVQFIPFSVVFLLQKLQPVFATATGAIFLKETLSKSYFKWAGLAIIAAYFVTFKNGQVNFATGGGTSLAALMALGAAFAWATSTAFSRFSLLKHSHTLITGLRFWLAIPMAFAAVVIMGQQSSLSLVTSGQLIRLALIASSTGMVAMAIYYRGLKYTQVKVTTIIELLFPMVAVVIDIFLYKTVLAPTQYLAAIVLLFAAYRVSRLNTVNA